MRTVRTAFFNKNYFGLDFFYQNSELNFEGELILYLMDNSCEKKIRSNSPITFIREYNQMHYDKFGLADADGPTQVEAQYLRTFRSGALPITGNFWFIRDFV